MKRVPAAIEGPVILEPTVFGDDRGFFLESWNAQTFAGLGLDLDFVQDNHSRSAKGVLRGLHYQNPHPQGKLVRVVSGAVFDVAVDLFGSAVDVDRAGAQRERGERGPDGDGRKKDQLHSRTVTHRRRSSHTFPERCRRFTAWRDSR